MPIISILWLDRMSDSADIYLNPKVIWDNAKYGLNANQAASPHHRAAGERNSMTELKI